MASITSTSTAAVTEPTVAPPIAAVNPYLFTTPRTHQTLRIRAATVADAYAMGSVAAHAYAHTALSQFLAPRRFEFWGHTIYGYALRIRTRIVMPRCLGVVVETVPAQDPTGRSTAARPRIIGYAQFTRLGDDPAALAMVAARNTLWMRVQRFFVQTWEALYRAVYGAPGTDAENLQAFLASGEVDGRRFWDGEANAAHAVYASRWHAQSVVVDEQFRGEGVGKHMMRQALAWAERENVVVGLEASTLGRYLYESVGFVKRGDFSLGIPEDVGGGIMMWTPPAWKA